MNYDLTGVLLLILGPLGFEALWTSWVVPVKTLILFTMMGLLSYVHFSLQPRIDSLVSQIGPEDAIPDGFAARLKPSIFFQGITSETKWMKSEPSQEQRRSLSGNLHDMGDNFLVVFHVFGN